MEQEEEKLGSCLHTRFSDQKAKMKTKVTFSPLTLTHWVVHDCTSQNKYSLLPYVGID